MSILPKAVYKQLISCFIASMPLMLAGITLGWSSPMIQYIANGKSPVHMSSEQESWMVTFIDIGNIIVSIPSGILMNYLGRKYTLYLSIPLAMAGWMLILTAQQPWHLYVARFLHGSSMAIAMIVSPSYVGEMASISIRGSVILVVDFMYALGLLLSYVLGWLYDYKTFATIGITMPMITGVLMAFIPESPYFLIMKGKPEAAARSLRALRSNDDDEAFRQELEIVQQSAVEEKYENENLKNLLNRDRTPLIIVLTLSVLHMACGASVLEAYASSVLNGTTLSPDVSAIIFGAFVVLACVPFALFVDRYGRRPLLLVSCVGTTASHALVVVLLSIPNTSLVGWSLLAAICSAEFFVNIGIIPLVSVVQCEYFPSDTRNLANSAVVFVITLTSTIMLKIYQPITDVYGKRANFILYAVITFLGALFCYYWVPETKGESFHQIQMDFETYTWRKKESRSNYQRI